MSTNTRDLKLARLDNIIGQETLNQIQNVASAGAKLVYLGCLVPGDVVTADASAAGVQVMTGTIVRIQAGADTYVAFGDSAIGAVTSSTSPAVKLTTGYHIVVATDNYMRCSANPTRIELVTV